MPSTLLDQRLGGGLIADVGSAAAKCQNTKVRIAILGGSWFLGRALAISAVQSGHQVVVFNRGLSGTDPEGVTAVRGDRESMEDLARLAERGPFDAVFDPSGQIPQVVLASARALSDANRYIYISSVSAYAGWPVEPLTEDSALLDCPPDADADFGVDDPRGYPTQYGFRKAGCERAVESTFGDRATVLRPGVILGPNEYIGRLPWWLLRVARGGQVLAPGSPDQPIQVVDVRDVAAFALHSAEQGIGGAFNIAAPPVSTFATLLDACRSATDSNASFVWIDDAHLEAAGVRQWTEIPLWRTYPGTWRVSVGKALAAGLRCRPLAATVTDTWSWMTDGQAAVEHERAGELGISSAKEAEILAQRSGA